MEACIAATLNPEELMGLSILAIGDEGLTGLDPLWQVDLRDADEPSKVPVAGSAAVGHALIGPQLTFDQSIIHGLHSLDVSAEQEEGDDADGDEDGEQDIADGGNHGHIHAFRLFSKSSGTPVPSVHARLMCHHRSV